MDETNFIINENCLLKINLNTISSNYKKIQKDVSENSKVSAVLKSNAYGLGLESIAKKLIKTGCKSFFLNSIKEALNEIEDINKQINLFNKTTNNPMK